MKLAIIAFVVTALCLVQIQSASAGEVSVLSQFQTFVKSYNKVYASTEEYAERFQNFKASLQKIEKLNALNPNGARFGINEFSDLSEEEFQTMYLMKNTEAADTDASLMETTPLSDDEPKQIDWRARGAVTAVKKQGGCGGCWAFSATETVESMWLKAGLAKPENFSLSPQQLIDCDGSDNGCYGGWPYNALQYVINVGGIVSEKDYPYVEHSNQICMMKKNATKAASIRHWGWVSNTTTVDGERAIRNALVTYGPLSITVDATTWSAYVGGVMTADQCNCQFLNHAVQVVGYDATANPPYWIVRNSWGPRFGYGGYIYLEMGSNACCITSLALYATVD